MTEPGPDTRLGVGSAGQANPEPALTGVLAEIAEAAGPAAALQLARAVGGSPIYVARAPKAGSLLVDAVGLKAARVAEPEGPSFISRTVAQRRLDRRYS